MVYLNHIENGAVKNSHKISGSGATTVTSDSSGNLVIASTNTTYSAAGTSLGLVKSGNGFVLTSGVISIDDEVTLDDINALTGNVDIETGNTLTLAGILGGEVTQDDIDNLFSV